MKQYFTFVLLFCSLIIQAQSYSVDTTFGINGQTTTGTTLTPKNGYFYNNQHYLLFDNAVARYSQNGFLDTSFGNTGFAGLSIAGLSPSISNFKMFNGKSYCFGLNFIAYYRTDGLIIRLNEDGQLDTTFGTNGYVKPNFGQIVKFNDIMINADGTFYALGRTKNPDTDFEQVILCRFLADGTSDNSFNGNGYKVFTNSQTRSGQSLYRYQNDILLASQSNATGQSPDLVLQKVDDNGNLISSFGTNGELRFPLGGNSSGFDYIDRTELVGDKIYCYSVAVTVFGTNVLYTNWLSAFDIANPASILMHRKFYYGSITYFKAFDSGKVMITSISDGCFPSASCHPQHFTLVRYNNDGTLDTSFNNNGIYEYDFSTTSQLEQATYFYLHDDGRIFLAGKSTNLKMLRIEPSNLANEETVFQNNISVYPNPSSKTLHIYNKTNAILENIFISDISGKKIETHESNNSSIDISDLSKGIYFLSFTADGNYHTIKFLKS